MELRMIMQAALGQGNVMSVWEIAYSEEDEAYTYTYGDMVSTPRGDGRVQEKTCVLIVGKAHLGSEGADKATDDTEALIGELIGFSPVSGITDAVAMEMISKMAESLGNVAIAVAGAIMDLVKSYDTALKGGEILKINDGNRAVSSLDLYYASAIDVKSGQHIAQVYPTPDTIHLVEGFNNEYLDSENQITLREALTDPVRTSEKLKTVPIHVQEAYKEIIQNLGAEENNNAEE